MSESDTPQELVLYVDCMKRVRAHAKKIQAVLTSSLNLGDTYSNTEFVFLRLRKAMEEIVFATLTANREKYAEVRPTDYSTDWRINQILERIQKFNPNFYPLSLCPPVEQADGIKHFERRSSDFLTLDQLTDLYSKSGQVLHSRNPFSTEDPVIQLSMTIPEYLQRTFHLLEWHVARLVDDQKFWVINVPPKGNITGFLPVGDSPFHFMPSD